MQSSGPRAPQPDPNLEAVLSRVYRPGDDIPDAPPGYVLGGSADETGFVNRFMPAPTPEQAREAALDRREGIAAAQHRGLVSQLQRNRAMLRRCRKEGPEGLRYYGLCGEEAYRLLGAQTAMLQRQLDAAVPLLLRRAVRRRAARMQTRQRPVSVRVPRRAAPSSGRPAARRASSSSTTSSADPGDDSGPHQPAGARRPAPARTTGVAR